MDFAQQCFRSKLHKVQLKVPARGTGNVVANSQYRNAVASGQDPLLGPVLVAWTRRYRVPVLTVCHYIPGFEDWEIVVILKLPHY